MPDKILGVEMGEWRPTSTLGMRERFGVRWVNSRAVSVTLRHLGTVGIDLTSVHVMWNRDEVGTGWCDDFDEAMSQLRHELACVGHRVFGEERGR